MIHCQMSIIAMVLDVSRWMGVLAVLVRTAFRANATVVLVKVPMVWVVVVRAHCPFTY